jgi:2-phospho-L-lactate transferase/gluconeogenesis factor (CofD/UPF0052 family)
VLRALRNHDGDLTVIVAVVDEAGHAGEPQGDVTGSAVSDLRRSLEALTDDEVALARAIKRPLKIDRLGRHPLGNLIIQSLASGFGDLGEASAWLGEQLGIAGSVLPATVEPVRLMREDDWIRFIPERPAVSHLVLDAIKHSQWVLLAPGHLFHSVLAATAIPDTASALRDTRARVLWICNLEPERDETASDQLLAFRRLGVRVDAVLYDPDAPLHFVPEQLASQGVEALPRRLRGAKRGRHDRALLRRALEELVDLPAISKLHE